VTTEQKPAAISKSRLEFLFDGVFAIAMTLLVLELRIPELTARHSTHELAHALTEQTSTFFSYVLSFIVLGLLWYRHNHQYPQFRRITGGMVILHFVQLATAAFFPFCAALFGRYPFNPLSGVIYVACILTYGWASLGNWIVAERSGSLEAEITPAEFKRTRNRLFVRCLALTGMLGFYLVKVLVQ
jgi:uncharacterized membrane protein